MAQLSLQNPETSGGHIEFQLEFVFMPLVNLPGPIC
jgi:hypothetical protein